MVSNVFSFDMPELHAPTFFLLTQWCQGWMVYEIHLDRDRSPYALSCITSWLLRDLEEIVKLELHASFGIRTSH
jgi:hypothetical protein